MLGCLEVFMSDHFDSIQKKLTTTIDSLFTHFIVLMLKNKGLVCI